MPSLSPFITSDSAIDSIPSVIRLAQPELLLPAGDPIKLQYAIAYGADAVYFGLPMASLRTPNRGPQFTPQNLGDWIRYAQARSVKAYITINIFPSNPDIKRIIPHLEQLATLKPDAIIFSDPGVYRLAKRYAPLVPLHLSTQANTLNVQACAFWQDLGVERVILAREVPIREVREIHEALPDLELECFVHGSLCVAYSGRCVISDYLTDNTKNSNKGMCGNSCRWEFNEAGHKTLDMQEATRPDTVYTFEEDDKGTYMLNSKDLCLVRHVRELVDAGVVSLKVEGRTKSLYYVSTVGQVYREAPQFLADHPDEDPPEALTTRWVAELAEAGNRGFTEGFFNGRPNADAYSYDTNQTRQTSTFLAVAAPEDTPRPVHLSATGKSIDEPFIAVQARNPFSLNESLEWMLPGSSAAFPVTTLLDKDGFPITSLQTNQIAWMPLPKGIEPTQEKLSWLILRRKFVDSHSVR